jgi:hypothetical protein
MHEGPIVAETRKLRQELMNEVGNDLDRLFDYLRQREDQHADRLVSFAPRRVAMGGVIADRKLED